MVAIARHGKVKAASEIYRFVFPLFSLIHATAAAALLIKANKGNEKKKK
jgi:hypothetical protein